MSIKTQLADGSGRNYVARVSSAGQLVVAPFAYDTTIFKELAEPDVAYNYYGPLSGQQFIITGLVAKADKQVSAVADADVIIYESTAPDSLTESRVLFQAAMAQGDIIVVTPLNILATEGVYVNAKTDDDDIHMTITGYYIPKIQ